MNTEMTFHVLANPIRRGILAVLRESNSVERDELVAHLADGDETDRHRIRVALHHNHLPKLDDADLLTYDGETVVATSRLETVACRFGLLDANDRGPALA